MSTALRDAPLRIARLPGRTRGSAQRARDGADLRDSLRRHRKGTEGHVADLEHAFQALGAEGHANLKMVDDALNDEVILAGVCETEHHEIAVYEGLITKAEAMGEQDVAATSPGESRAAGDAEARATARAEGRTAGRSRRVSRGSGGGFSAVSPGTLTVQRRVRVVPSPTISSASLRWERRRR